MVDDSPFARRVLIKCLRGAGLRRGEILEAEHGEHALSIVAENSIHLIVTDLVMPVMDGAEFVARLRQDPNNSEIRVVVVSSIAEAATRQKLIESGANEVLSKPITGPKALQILKIAMKVGA